MSNKILLSIKNVSKSFGTNQVLKDVSFNIKEGHVCGFMGENGAGKSTLMKCLFGMYSVSSGSFELLGKEISFKNSKEALENGIAMVHQELNQCLDRTVADNLFLGRYIAFNGIVNDKIMQEKALLLLQKNGLYGINPTDKMRNLSVSKRQMVEIAKAISYDAKLIVLDEPTSSLSEKETEMLYKMIERLKNQGISFVFISHKMDEIFRICDDIVVLRDGVVTMNQEIKKTSLDDIVKAMVGRSLSSRFPPLTNKPGPVVLDVKRLETKFNPQLKDVTFQLHAGEILGIYGLVGSGRTRLLNSLFGMMSLSESQVYYKGERILFKSPKEAMDYGFAYITEERKVTGMFPKETLLFNTAITNLDKAHNGLVVDKRKMREMTDKHIKGLKVKCQNKKDKIGSLSGGNQQKIIIGKWLERMPDVFLMDEPTRGIDIVAKYQIYELMIKLAMMGKSIIICSSEMPEILGVTNRVMVMSNRHLAGILDTEKATQEKIMQLCSKYI